MTLTRQVPGRLLSSVPRWSRASFSELGFPSAASADYTDGIAVGKPGKCPKKPVLLIGLYDNSGSITGGNDPIGQRFLEAALAVSRVGSRCRCGKDLVATLHFDTPTSGDLAPTPIIGENKEEIEASLSIPPDGAGISCLGPSLLAAYELAISHGRTHKLVVVALTDFELFDDFLDQFIAFPGDVHAVALRTVAPGRLVDAPNVTVTQIDHGSPPGAVARAVFTAMTAIRPNAHPLQPEGLLAQT